jgi:hypothetical protein
MVICFHHFMYVFMEENYQILVLQVVSNITIEYNASIFRAEVLIGLISLHK